MWAGCYLLVVNHLIPNQINLPCYFHTFWTLLYNMLPYREHTLLVWCGGCWHVKSFVSVVPSAERCHGMSWWISTSTGIQKRWGYSATSIRIWGEGVEIPEIRTLRKQILFILHPNLETSLFLASVVPLYLYVIVIFWTPPFFFFFI